MEWIVIMAVSGETHIVILVTFEKQYSSEWWEM